ncbi:cytochrome c oxidase assembly protein COX11, mitochondrial [Neodiprion pinetum]|uniref:Cytochrome c oxidase assembly protein COX11, mitochondrial n=1 Tax=Neodiprion lecontei TaxID=441921 RepID=A0A6J0BP49_NEOLC|nr:cytochrome c oxidase assembly protein COX11, mitochondrial [Neodiprion lecontei]XP_046472305.1 cytochrome c oxidase assembly protein COX11, mitochondrial [Neodiprion pinetum]
MYYRTCRGIALMRNRQFSTNVGKNLFKEYDSSKSTVHSERKTNLRATLHYVTAAGVLAVGLSYAAVPLYRLFCRAYSYGGTTATGHDASKIETMKSIQNRQFKVRFNADVGASMRWNFKPQQNEIDVVPGETALAFYTATNPSDKPVVGISTYNVVPFEAGQYFNKIQCFCFEEQMLNPHEQVDMPVFFYLDPEIVEDPKLEYIDEITLSYTFFEARDGLKLPLPGYANRHS